MSALLTILTASAVVNEHIHCSNKRCEIIEIVFPAKSNAVNNVSDKILQNTRCNS